MTRIGLTVLAALVAACNIGLTAPEPSAFNAGQNNDAPPYDAGNAFVEGGGGSHEAGLAPKPVSLCGEPGPCAPDAGPNAVCGCSPDDRMPLCGTPDAGAANTDAGAPHYSACHVVAGDHTNGANPPECTPAGAKRDYEPCQLGTDCAPGYECVTGGVCRRYCCSGACDTATPSFCDVQTLNEVTSAKVPVCIGIQHCDLLGNSCQAGSTQCAVVHDDTPHDSATADWMTSCVDIGVASVGQSCDIEHCALGLVCLGNVGAKKCWQLCGVDATGACPGDLQCEATPPYFTGSVGICVSPAMKTPAP